jgi:hypothetical protein
MKKLVLAFVVASIAVGIGVGAAISSGDGRTVLEFDTMAPVTEPYTGSDHPIRGVDGGGLPWILGSAEGELRASGAIQVEVEGLVLARRRPVPRDLRGKNPSPTFKAIVSCESIVGGEAQTVNVETAPAPATPTGDSEIRGRVTLPSPCFAPVVFVTSGGGSWFAVTGR